MMKVIVIGGVAAGMSAASKLKRTMKDGVDIEVFEKGREISYGACGLPFYVSGKIREAAELVERTAEQFAAQGVTVRLEHEVTAVDTKEKTVTVRDIAADETFTRGYDKLIVASGARVRRIPPLDVDMDNLHVMRNVADAVRLRRQLEDEGVRNVVVVGAGFIGLEIAEACVRQGKRVTVVEFAERVLTVMDPEFTDRLTGELERNRVAVRVDSKVVELVCDGSRITGVVVRGGGKRETVAADVVVNAAGIVPNAEFIDVKKAVNGAILVDERMETSAEDVYAAGDCSIMTSFVTGEHMYAPLGTNANKQGRLIAEILSGKGGRRLKLVGSSALRLFGLDAAKVGLSETDAQRMHLDYKVSLIVGNSYASYYESGEVMVKVVYGAGDRRILGAQVIGEGVVAGRANYFAIAISAGMTVDEFGFLDLCYSPPFGGVWDATLIAANTAK